MFLDLEEIKTLPCLNLSLKPLGSISRFDYLIEIVLQILDRVVLLLEDCVKIQEYNFFPDTRQKDPKYK